MDGPFSKGFLSQMGDNLWEANLLRGCSAWWIKDWIIMPRAEEFSLGWASEDYLEVCFVGLVVRENYSYMVLSHICHIYGIWRSRGGGLFWRHRLGVGMQATRGGCNFNGEGGMGFSLYVILLCWNFVTGYCKGFYRIPPFPIFLLFHLLCIYWDWQG